MHILQWSHSGERYEAGFFIGSEREDGSHSRSTDHWPFSIYRKANQMGVTDAVLCHGIQSIEDARELLRLIEQSNEVAIWKDRYEASEQAHQATIHHCEELLREARAL